MMSPWFSRPTRRALALAFLSAGAAACDEASAPTGRLGAVEVHAYVDRDATGTPTAADSLLSVAVTILQDGEPVATAQTDADGIAIVDSVPPGSYLVQVTGGAPAGATLVSNPVPAAAVGYGGDTAVVEFRYAFFPGSLAGVVYKDVNGDGDFDAGTDEAAAGVSVDLFAGSDTTGALVATTVTDAAGAYLFPLLAPGTYTLRFERLGAMSYTAGARVQTVTVPPQADLQANATFTGSVFMWISEARATPVDSVVAVRGVITVPPGIFTSGTGGARSEIWVQDSTGGIAIFFVRTSDSTFLDVGDTVEVVGKLGFFRGQEQIVAIAAGDTITPVVRGSGPAPAPVVVTGAAVNARTDEGELVLLPGFTVDSIPGTSSSFFTVYGTAPDGRTVAVRVNGIAGLGRSAIAVGTTYNVIGVLTQFDSLSQIKPRFASDFQPATVAAVRAATVGSTVAAAGYLTVAPGTFTSGSGGSNSEIWVQDSTGGIAVFSVPTSDSATLDVGDRVLVSGTLGSFNNQLQIGSPTVLERAGSFVFAPVPLTGSEVLARTDEGELVVVDSLQVVSVATGSSFNVTTQARDGSTVILRIQSSTGLTQSSFTVGQYYRVTGILTQFRGTSQIKPRGPADVVAQ